MSATNQNDPQMESIFEKYLALWVSLCMIAGLTLGYLSPQLAKELDDLNIKVNGAPIVSLPIAICLFFMMYPIMVKIDFTNVLKAGKAAKPILLTLFLNWVVAPLAMFGIAYLFLGVFFKHYIGENAVDLIKIPFGLDLPVGALYGSGKIVLQDGIKYLEIPLWRSYFAGCILLGSAPCTAMVLVWTHLAKGNNGLTLVMVAVNSLSMLLLYGPIAGFLLGIGDLPVSWKALAISLSVYVALPLIAGYFSRKWLLKLKGEKWFKEKFLHFLTPISIIALLLTLVLVFSLKGSIIIANPLTILWIAIPLTIDLLIVFFIGYYLAKFFKIEYQNAAPVALIGASNHFEVAIATATLLFGLSSGASLATVVCVLIEVPLMLLLVKICLKTKSSFP
jgi:ACR3 family arsenite transporter